MFERFLSGLTSEDPAATPREVWDNASLMRVPGYTTLMEAHAGHSFDRGVYRLHDAASGPVGLAAAREAFPEHPTAVPFGHDWLGRQFAIDDTRQQDGQPLVLMLDPGAGQALEIPTNFVEFHDDELVEYGEAALARDFFDRWLASDSSGTLESGTCVGYKTPLFAGGADDLENLSRTDVEVYWSLCAQLRAALGLLPVGTPVTAVTGTPVPPRRTGFRRA